MSQTIIKKLLLVLSMLITSSAFAQDDWVEIAESRLGTTYINPASLRKSGEFRKIWSINDFKNIDYVFKDGKKRRSLSVKIREEYDCTGERVRLLSSTRFTDRMGEGAVIDNSSGVGEWRDVAPGSVGELAFNFVCKL